VGDLSTWYLRRSRERIKEGDINAKETLYYVLKTMAKLLAPFAPFSADDIWQKLKTQNDPESVHLAEWPKVKTRLFNFGKTMVLEEMKQVREVISTLLKERQKANIPVRQALLSASGPSVIKKYLEIVKDELNVKVYSMGSYGIDTNITPELKQEGDYRELVRALQDMRKKMGLTPSEVVNLEVETNLSGKELLEKFGTDLKKTVLVSNIELKANDGEEIKIGELVFKVQIAKI
jgi:isoleucyl-tRNA synthetase